MLNTVHVVHGPGWFVEFEKRADAQAALALLHLEGKEAYYKETLPATFKLVVEFYPKGAGLRNGHPEPRRHKWAYGQWQKGAPAGYHPLTGEVKGMAIAKREYTNTGAHTWYNPAPEAAPPAAPPPTPAKHINGVTGKATIFADAAFFQ